MNNIFLSQQISSRYQPSEHGNGLRGLVSVVFHPRMDGRLSTTSKSDDDCCRAVVEASAGWCAILVVKELSRENMVSCMYIVVVNYYSTLLVVFIRIFL